MIELTKVKKGEFVRRKDSSSTTYTKGEYDRASKRFMLNDESDCGRCIFLKGSTKVSVDFDY